MIDTNPDTNAIKVIDDPTIFPAHSIGTHVLTIHHDRYNYISYCSFNGIIKEVRKAYKTTRPQDSEYSKRWSCYRIQTQIGFEYYVEFYGDRFSSMKKEHNLCNGLWLDADCFHEIFNKPY